MLDPQFVAPVDANEQDSAGPARLGAVDRDSGSIGCRAAIRCNFDVGGRAVVLRQPSNKVRGGLVGEPFRSESLVDQ